MKIAITLKFIIILFTFTSLVQARPVSYVGGLTLMSFNDYQSNSLLIHYTPSSKYSLGYNIEYWNDKEFWINNLNLNYLLKRINTKKSQANFYFKSGLGFLYTDFKKNEKKKEYVSTLNFSADWETRSKFVSYSSELIKSENIANIFLQKARVGFAPYIASYGEIHTWLMYELNYMSSGDNNLKSAAILRFFKSTNLFEAGIDVDKNILLNYIKRF
ncbi:MAG: hypothetical protein CBC22_00235 [Alphaproteobacteria bacterium TMED62]|nr:MAG: hypothetical protein CBC22_00235 [Alphaproteobacteria bacterium TMED62]|tara:strand:+ start:4180 stop:4827 length:648 start_codon:yes stop_codon:yes gene_type:complete